MPKIISFGSGPIPPDPSEKLLHDAKPTSCALQWVHIDKNEAWEEFTIKHPNGEIKTHRRWFDPKTNNQRRETEQTLEILNRMPSLESATHSSKERKHRKRETRALGNKLRGEAKRRGEATRKDL